MRLHANSERDYATKIDTLTELGPGESRQISVVVNTGSASATELVRHHVALVAEAEGGLDGDGQGVPRAVASVRVIPRNDGAAAPWHNVPLDVKLSSQTHQLSDFSASTSQPFEVSRGGPLTDGASSILQ